MVVAKPIGGHLASRAVPALRASFRHLSDVYLLAQGGYAPVGGFLNAREVKSVCETLHLMTGEPWSMPVVYPIDDDARSRLGSADQVVLLDESGPAAKLQVESTRACMPTISSARGTNRIRVSLGCSRRAIIPWPEPSR